jgi:hypothetical protein
MAAIRKADVKVGDIFTARVSDKVVKVRVDEIVDNKQVRGLGTLGQRRLYRKASTTYQCTNLSTGRSVTIKSAAKFRQRVIRPTVPACEACGRPLRMQYPGGDPENGPARLACADRDCVGHYPERNQPIFGFAEGSPENPGKLTAREMYEAPNGTEKNLSRREYSRLNEGGLAASEADLAGQ